MQGYKNNKIVRNMEFLHQIKLKEPILVGPNLVKSSHSYI